VDVAGLLGKTRGVPVEDHLAAVELGQERGDGVLGECGGVDAATEGVQVDSRVQLRAPRQTPLGLRDVLGAPAGSLRDGVLEADVPVHPVR
jgi:hypothetical protein